jgi:hypothetical protein
MQREEDRSLEIDSRASEDRVLGRKGKLLHVRGACCKLRIMTDFTLVVYLLMRLKQEIMTDHRFNNNPKGIISSN